MAKALTMTITYWNISIFNELCEGYLVEDMDK